MESRKRLIKIYKDLDDPYVDVILTGMAETPRERFEFTRCAHLKKLEYIIVGGFAGKKTSESSRRRNDRRFYPVWWWRWRRLISTPIVQK